MRVGHSVLQALVAHVLSLVYTLHPYEVAHNLRRIKIGSCKNLSKALKGLVNVSLEESSLDKDALLPLEEVEVIWAVAEFVNAHLQSVR